MGQLNITNAIGEGVTEYYSVSELVLNEGPSFLWLGTLIGTPPAIWLIDKYGMRLSIIVYSILSVGGSALNLLINSNLPGSYYWSFAASLTIGIGSIILSYLD